MQLIPVAHYVKDSSGQMVSGPSAGSRVAGPSGVQYHVSPKGLLHVLLGNTPNPSAGVYPEDWEEFKKFPQVFRKVDMAPGELVIGGGDRNLDAIVEAKFKEWIRRLGLAKVLPSSTKAKGSYGADPGDLGEVSSGDPEIDRLAAALQSADLPDPPPMTAAFGEKASSSDDDMDGPQRDIDDDGGAEALPPLPTDPDAMTATQWTKAAEERGVTIPGEVARGKKADLVEFILKALAD